MTASWKQSPLHLMVAHTLLKGFGKLKLKSWSKHPFVLFPRHLFRSCFHAFPCFCLHTLLPSQSSQPYLQVTVNCTETASFLHSKLLISLLLHLYASPVGSVLLSKPLISEAGLLRSRGNSENTRDMTMTDDSLSARCLNQGQSAFSALPVLVHTHTHMYNSWHTHTCTQNN